MPNPIRDYLDALRAQREHDRQSYTKPPEQPDWEKQSTQFRIEWRPTALAPLPDPLPLEEVREGITRQIMLYATNPNYDGELLLIRVPPGTGKTTAAVNAVQKLSYKRVLYAASRHDFYQDVRLVPGFNPELWYEWKPICEDTCRYHKSMLAWLNRGYPSSIFCNQVCQYDRHIQFCSYRAQRKRTEPIIFGMHQHLITGMAISNYGLGICDEMPLNAFLNRRQVPLSGILVPGAAEPMAALFRRLDMVARQAKVPLHGKDLLQVIGDVLGDVFDIVDAGSLFDSIPIAPDINAPEEAMDAPYWYIFDFLKLISPEYECWKNEWDDWLSRVWVSKDGILLLDRFHARDKWRGPGETYHPQRLICLDATGSKEMYYRLFGREIVEYAPRVERPGRVFQVAGRLYGTSETMTDVGKGRKRLSKHGIQLLKTADLIAKQYEGKRCVAVTFKAAEIEFERTFGEGNVRHFGALRGTNDLESADCLIVAGGYCPSMEGTFNLCAALHPERMHPFVKTIDGKPVAPWSHQSREYRMKSPSRLVPWRKVAGFWQDPDLTVVLEEFRRNEIVQALHRVRPNLKASDVWLLTSLPTGEPLDAIYENVSDLAFTPGREKVEKTTRDGRVYPAWEGITWECWLLLYRWMDRKWEDAVEYLTKEDLATQANVSVSTVQSQKWLDYLDRFYRDKEKPWALAQRRTSPDRSRKTWVLIPMDP